MKAKISKRLLPALEPTDNKWFVWDEGDGSVKGFGVCIYPSGEKSYVYQYRNAHGRTRRPSIGSVAALTPDQARKEARKLEARVRSGHSPADESRERRRALTLGQVLDEYLKSQAFKQKALSTQKTDQSRIERHLRPLLGSKVMESVTREDVRRAFAQIRDGKTAKDIKTGPRGRAIVRGGEGAARKAIRILRAILNWAIEESLVEHNPAAGIRLGSDAVREVFLEEVDDYERLFDVIQQLENLRQIRSEAADAIRLIALTGARKGEITGLRWSHVDLRLGLLVLPPKAHKTGSKTGRPREIPLSSLAAEIVARQPAGAPEDFVFKPAKGTGKMDLKKSWDKVRDAAGLPGNFGLHGLRHSLGTQMALQNASMVEIKAVLGHAEVATTERYIHLARKYREAQSDKHTKGISAALRKSMGELNE